MLNYTRSHIVQIRMIAILTLVLVTLTDTLWVWRTLAATIGKHVFRISPAATTMFAPTFVESGATLSLTLNAANESVAIVSNGNSYTFTSNNNWSGTDSANVTGNGTTTLTVTTAGLAAFSQLIITDAAVAGTSVTFNNSGANAYTDNFDIVLDDLGAGTITFNGTTNFTGANTLSASTSRNIVVSSGASTTTADGDLTLSANQQVTPTAANFFGVQVNGSLLGATGAGNVTVKGKGGSSTNGANFGVVVNNMNARITASGGAVLVEGIGGGAGTSSFNIGVIVDAGGVITNAGSGAGATVTVKGQGGNLTSAHGSQNYGVMVNTWAEITANGSAVLVEGTGGGAGTSGRNIGVVVAVGGIITNAGSGAGATVTVKGQGGNLTGSGDSNYGVYVTGVNAQITANGGAVLVEGTGGGGEGTSSDNYGVFVHTGSVITNAGTGVGATVTVKGQGGNPRGTGGFTNIGVYVFKANAQITASGGAVLVEGTGGGAGWSINNHGVFADAGGVITNAGSGAGATVTVRGFGGNLNGTRGDTNYGVLVFNTASQITANGGAVLVEGTGGGAGTAGRNFGTLVQLGGVITNAGISAGATVTIRGFGGNLTGSGDSNWGVGVVDTNSQITASGGAVLIEGTGGGSGPSTNNHGVVVGTGGMITNAGIGAGVTVTVKGFGGNLTGIGNINFGVWVFDTNSQISSSGGALAIIGSSGGGTNSSAIRLQSGGQIVATTGHPTMTLCGDSMEFLSTPSVDAGTNPVVLKPRTAGTFINLGGGDVLTGSPLTLGLTDTELDQVTAGTLTIGDNASGTITVSADLTRPASTVMSLVSGGNVTLSGGQVNTGGGTLLLDPGVAPFAVRPTKASTDVTASTLSFGSDLAIVINGLTVDTQYTQLNVAGGVNLTGVNLMLSGTFVPTIGDVFTIVAASNVTNTFNGLPNGSSFAFNGRMLQIAYSATTVTLTVITPQIALPAPSLTDPLACSGPGNKVNGSFSATNTSTGPTSLVLTATLTNVVVLPDSARADQPGTLAIAAGGITWRGTLGAGQTVTVNWMGELADDTLNGAQACSNITATANSVSVPGSASACLTVNCPPAGPGTLPNDQTAVSDQKPGSVLVYPIYSSSASNASTQNTRIAITSTNPTRTAYIHLFFVDGSSCSVADSYICLTPNQTATVLASDIDPGTTGYLIAVAVNATGCPINFNHLIGDEFVKLAIGHQSNFGAESIAAIAGGLPACNPLTDNNAVLAFNNVSYNALPRVLASSNIPSRGDGNDTYVVINRIGGNLSSNASTIGGLFGILYDDAEAAYSFSLPASACQLAGSITNDRPRLVPRFETVVPSGRTGWFKLWGASEIGILGAQINRNANAGTTPGAFNHGHNLHKLTFTTTSAITIPVFPPSC